MEQCRVHAYIHKDRQTGWHLFTYRNITFAYSNIVAQYNLSDHVKYTYKCAGTDAELFVAVVMAGIAVMFASDALEQLVIGPGGRTGNGGIVAAPNITHKVIAHPQSPPTLAP